MIDQEGVLRMSEFTPSFDKIVETLDTLRAEPVANPLIGQPLGSLDQLHWIEPTKAPDLRTRKLTLLRWWTDGCPFCRQSLPDLSALATAKRDRGLRLVAVYHPKSDHPLDDDAQRAYLAQLGFAGERAADPDWTVLREVMRRGQLTRATSISVLVDDRGIVRWVHPGPRLHHSEEARYAEAERDMQALEKAVAELLHGNEHSESPATSRAGGK